MNDANDQVRQYWWSRAWESLEAAKRDFRAEAYSFAINRLYYAAFYPVSALLTKEHYSFSKHSGVRAAFHRYFVKTKKLEENWGMFYDRLFEDRHEGDYVEFVKFDHSYVGDQITRQDGKGNARPNSPKPERFEEYSRRQSARFLRAMPPVGQPTKTIRPEGAGEFLGEFQSERAPVYPKTKSIIRRSVLKTSLYVCCRNTVFHSIHGICGIEVLRRFQRRVV